MRMKRVGFGAGLLTVGMLLACAAGSSLSTEGPGAEARPCGGVLLPPGWPEPSLHNPEALLAPFLACASPADFVQQQRGVDMARLLRQLDDWNAVRLGALGPVDAPAAQVLNRQRADFLSFAAHEYGTALGEVFALFVLHSSSDEDLRQVLHLLAQDRHLSRTLGPMAVVGEQLRQRGLPLSDFPDRPARLGVDLARGAREGLGDIASSVPIIQWGQSVVYDSRKRQLPAPYQRALEQVEHALVQQAFSPGHLAVGIVDEMTFGVPLGCYYLAVGTGQGVASLAEGEYEQAARELTPAVLMVSLYAGGRGPRALGGAAESGRLRSLGSRLTELRQTAQRLREQLGAEGLEAVARYLQTDPEAALLVAEQGEVGALALHESQGSVPGARAWLSQARAEESSTTPQAGVGTGAGAEKAVALADEALAPREVLDLRLLEGEVEASGSRLSGDVAVLRKQLAALRESPPAGASSHPRWREYVRYGEGRLAELEQGVKMKKGRKVEPPLKWEGYQQMRGVVTRGLQFERAMAEVLRIDAALPRAVRRFLGDFDKPRVETYVGVWKEGSELRFADVLVIEEAPLSGTAPRVETFSFKSRNLASLGDQSLQAQILADTRQALEYYGQDLNIRRPTLQALVVGVDKVSVSRLRLIYEGGAFKPNNITKLSEAVNEAESTYPGVEVSFQ